MPVPDAYDRDALLDLIAAVARLADTAAPETVTQRRWDAARVGRYADAPAARQLAAMLRLAWPDARRIAQLNGAARARALGKRLGAAQQDWLTDSDVAFVLRLIARRLDVETVTPADYRAERQRMLDGDRGRWSVDGGLRLPNEEQIRTAAGSWNAALALAGLRPLQRGGQVPAVPPPTFAETLDRCFEHHGTQPTFGELQAFARANGIPFPRKEAGKPWSAYVAEWKAQRRERGLLVPDGPPPKAQRPDYARDVGAARPGETRIQKAYDSRDEVVAWVAVYIQTRPEGTRPSQRGYLDWRRGRDDGPWPRVFGRHGGWTSVLSDARRLVSAQADGP